MPYRSCACILLCLTLSSFLPYPLAAQHEGTPPGIHLLADHGPVTTPAEAQATLDRLARQLLTENGGTIFITSATAPEFDPRNTYQEHRESPAICLVDIRGGVFKIIPTPLGVRSYKWAGISVDRTLNRPGSGLGFWGQFAAAQVENRVITGSASFYQEVNERVAAGPDARIYADSVEGVTPGTQLCNYGAPETKSMFTVKEIGWDAQRQRYYMVADLDHPIPAGGRIGTKNMLPALNVQSWYNADHQTAGVVGLHTRAYGAGDLFNLSSTLKYQSNIMSTEGDEGAVLCELESSGDLDSFRAQVESFDPQSGTLIFKPGLVRAATLAPSRPIINLNPGKWITAGHVVIVPSGASWKGQKYPVVWQDGVPNPGGLIQGSADAPWDESVVGRYFAVDEDSEKYTRDEMRKRHFRGMSPGETVRRWYRITAFERHEDGTKSIRIFQVRWYALSSGSPNLFREENYSSGDRTVPLKYIIAPGALPADISEAWLNEAENLSPPDHPRRLRMVPNGDTGTRMDFAAGDPIVQAVGPDPHYPRMIRMVTSDYFPSSLNQDMIQLKNVGRTGRIGMSFTSKVRKMEDLARQKDGQPPYVDGIVFDSVIGVGLRFKRPVTEAAILMEQRDGNVQPIVWKHQGPSRRTTLAVDPGDGTARISGGDLDLDDQSLKNARIVATKGISATDEPARNLRGIDVPVRAGASELTIPFRTAEADGAYAVNVTPHWNTACWVSAKRAESFTVQFVNPPAEDSHLDWLIIR